MKTFCFKLYHSEYNYKLIRQINAAGLIYNHCIALHKRYYKLYGKYLDKSKLQKHLVKLKKHKRFAYINEIGSQAVQDVTDRIERAYKLFWSNLKYKKKCSPPKFRKVQTGKSVGLDFGLKQFLTGSDGHNIKSPYFFMLNIKIS